MNNIIFCKIKDLRRLYQKYDIPKDLINIGHEEEIVIYICNNNYDGFDFQNVVGYTKEDIISHYCNKFNRIAEEKANKLRKSVPIYYNCTEIEIE